MTYLRPIARGIEGALGNTPLVFLPTLSRNLSFDIFAKVEHFNPGGSAKDRPAVGMLQAAIAAGDVKPGDTVVESSSGNLGVALARACTARGVTFRCVVDTRANQSTVAAIRALDGVIELVSEPDPETGDLLTARRKRVAQLLEENDHFFNLNQYANPANPAAHRDGTAKEIVDAMEGKIDALLVAASTTGTLNGCRDRLDIEGLDTELIAVDALGSVLFGGEACVERHLPGMGAGLPTPLSENVVPDLVVRASDVDCVVGCRLLARTEGILAGASSGGVIHSLLSLRDHFEPGSRVVVILHDGGTPYLSTVYDDDWIHSTLGVAAAEVLSRGEELLNS